MQGQRKEGRGTEKVASFEKGRKRAGRRFAAAKGEGGSHPVISQKISASLGDEALSRGKKRKKEGEIEPGLPWPGGGGTS